jgi:hypothetical protein
MGKQRIKPNYRRRVLPLPDHSLLLAGMVQECRAFTCVAVPRRSDDWVHIWPVLRCCCNFLFSGVSNCSWTSWVNPQLRQLIVLSRGSSITESELVHTLSSEYPHTRTWAQFLHDSIPGIDGLAWRPRLGGTGISYALFGDRCDGQLEIQGAPISANSAAGLGKIRSIAKWANISIVDPENCPDHYRHITRPA